MKTEHQPILQARELECRYGHVVALRSASLAVCPGEVVLLAGPNGAGKSTLLRVLAGLIRPSRGTVLLDEKAVHGNPAARAKLGFLSHQTLLYDDLTARENLRFAATLHGLALVEQRVTDSLDAAGLLQRADTRVALLSHGTRQRLSIARATIHDPAVLLLDEPFSGLDRAAIARLSGQLGSDAGRGRAVICVTHQPADIWQIASRVIMLDRGSIVFDTPRPETVDEFLTSCDRAVAA